MSFQDIDTALKAAYNFRMGPFELADRAYTLERLFNIREGLTRDDDWLVDRYFDEPTKLGGRAQAI